MAPASVCRCSAYRQLTAANLAAHVQGMGSVAPLTAINARAGNRPWWPGPSAPGRKHRRAAAFAKAPQSRSSANSGHTPKSPTPVVRHGFRPYNQSFAVRKRPVAWNFDSATDAAGIHIRRMPAHCKLPKRSVVRFGERALHHLAMLGRQLFLSELEGELVDRATEAKRQAVAVVDRRAGVDPNVETLVDRHEERNGVLDFLARQLLPVNQEHTGTALAEAGSVVFEVEHDRVLAGFERVSQPVAASHATLPAVSLQIEEVVDKDRLTFEQVETVAAEAAAHCRDHSFRPGFRNRHLGGDRVVLVQKARSIAHWNAGIRTRVREDRSPGGRAWPRRNEAREDRVIQREDVVFRRLREKQPL